MDPEATWQLILYRLDNPGDHEGALSLIEELQEWNRKGGFLPEYLSGNMLERLRAGLMNNELKVGDTVYVTTDKYSPWLGKGAAGIITICEPQYNYYEVEFDDNRLYHFPSEDIGRTPHDF